MTQSLTRYCRILEIVGDLLKVEVRVGPEDGEAVARYGHLAVVENAGGGHSPAQVIHIDRDVVSLQVYGGTKGLSTAATVRFLGHPMRAIYSANILGRVFRGSGEPMEGGPDLSHDPEVAIGGPPVNPMGGCWPRA